MSLTMTPPGAEYNITAPNIESICPKDYVAKGTRPRVFFGVVVTVLVLLFSLLATYGIALVVWIIAGLSYIINRKRAEALLHGSALQVTGSQFPEIYQSCQRISRQMGLKNCPDVYIIEDNSQNAFAIKRGRKHTVVLIDDIVFGAEATGNKKALDFILAHEIAHHALGHTRGWRQLISSNYKPLSRLDEFSCDAVAHAALQDINAAQDALSLLLVGPQLFNRVDKSALHQQALEVTANKNSKRAEQRLTHPLLLRRYGRLVEKANAPAY